MPDSVIPLSVMPKYVIPGSPSPFGLLRRGAQTHEKKVGQQQIAVAAEGRTVLVRRTDY